MLLAAFTVFVGSIAVRLIFRSFAVGAKKKGKKEKKKKGKGASKGGFAALADEDEEEQAEEPVESEPEEDYLAGRKGA